MSDTHDSYLSNLSDESLQVLKHFGPEAPSRLNTYASKLEDFLLEALEHKSLDEKQLKALEIEHQAMQAILTDPDQLLDYVSGFFAPGGPCPGGAVISRCRNQAATV
ncbi:MULTISPECIES: hypothetical protein [Aphanothece]|uniref:hypothetical protein n=1 Tax=Aphanothece TaxID=1121 RepID=UPI0039853375